MRKTSLGLTAFLGFFACAQPERDRSVYDCSPPDSSTSHPRDAELKALAASAVAAGFPGIVIGLRDSSGRWIGAAGQADRALSVPSSTCQINHIGSISKTFMAATLLSLVDEGRVDLDAPARDFLPADVTKRIVNADQVSVRQLLDHTSGIFSYNDSLDFLTDLFNDPFRPVRGDDYARYAYGQPAYGAPGQRFRYSNTNYILLGMVIDAVTGEHHTSVMRKKIFEPLGLERTSYDWDEPNPPGIARGYAEVQGNGVLVDTTDYTLGQVQNAASGGVVSNVSDLLTFGDALFRDKRVLSAKSQEAMLGWVDVERYPNRLPRNKRYGLGVFFVEANGGYAIGHGGDNMGYTSFLYYVPERDVTIAALLNAGGDSPLYGERAGDVFNQLIALALE